LGARSLRGAFPTPRFDSASVFLLFASDILDLGWSALVKTLIRETEKGFFGRGKFLKN
jgi:hypothetical protein